MAFCREADLIKQQIHEKRLQLIDKIKKSEPNLVDIDTLIDEMAKIRAEMMKKTLAHHNQTRGLLTEEQKALLGTSRCGMAGSGMHSGMSCGMMGSGMLSGPGSSLPFFSGR